MNVKFFRVITILFSLLSTAYTAETFRLRNIYSDNMILQRDVPVKIYGFADAGELVTGVLANSPAVTAKADKNGEFILTFPAMGSGGPYNLSVKNSRDQLLEIKNILFGEVYLASGQSNMEMPLWSSKKFWRSSDGDKEVKKADFPQIRFVKIPYKLSHKKVETDIAKVSWRPVTPATAAANSAVAYYFAKEMHRQLNVPIGIIQSAWSGTQIEPWISKEAFYDSNDSAGIKHFADYEVNFETRKLHYNRELAVWSEKFNNFNPELSAKAKHWKDIDYDDSNWDKITLPGTLTYTFDINWVRKTVDIPEEMSGKDLILTIGAIDDCDETYFNGVKIGSVTITDDDHWQKVRKYHIPADIVKKGKNLIAVRIFNYYAVGAVENNRHGLTLSTADGKCKTDLAGEWLIRNEMIVDIAKTGERPSFISNNPRTWNSTIYNAMINPCIIYPIRGVIWYQGCSNGNEYQRYARLFPMLIRNWRKKWQNPQMPFVFVQLSAFGKQSPAVRPDENNWKTIKPLYASGEGYARIREVQAAALRIPYTGMAVSIDAGDQYDIHPARKEPVGYRLAQEALRLSFGKKEITSSPRFRKMKIENNCIRLFFVNADNGLICTGDKINGFAIAGKDGVCHAADAKIVNSNEIVVSSANVAAPCKVFYAFCGYPGELNLYNREGFPMTPFRTEVPDYLRDMQ